MKLADARISARNRQRIQRFLHRRKVGVGNDGEEGKRGRGKEY